MQLPADFLQQADFGLPTAEHPLFLEALDGNAPTSVRLNPFKQPFLQSGAKFTENAPVAWEAMGRYLPERLSFTTDVDFWAGSYYVQEASSMFVGEVLRQVLPLEKALTVLDLCAAPGGKSTHILSLLSPESILVSNEIVKQRTHILGENLSRWGQGNYILTNQNSAQIGTLTGVFDAIVVDAPCSGEGMFRKDKEARKEWSLANVRTCVSRQGEILENIAPTLKENGFLIYSTCTFNSHENEKSLFALLEQGWESIQLNVPSDWGIVQQETEHANKTLYSYRFYPHLVVGEGFFISCLQKTDREKNRKLHVKNPHLLPVPTRKQDFLQDWVGELGAFKFYQTAKNDIFAMPEAQAERMHLIGETLGAWSAGYHIGTRKHDDLEPAPAWALSGKVSSSLPTVDLPTDIALEFLRKNELTALPVTAQKGWHLATHNGLGLGWLKALPTRWNNYYPAQWRIRHL